TVSYRRNAIMVGVEDGFEYSEDLRDWTELSGFAAPVSDSQVEIVSDVSVEERRLVVSLSEDVEAAFVRRIAKEE
ncbi:hypothetical protein, partial [Pelagicoccus sp. SDUM812002]|uniref:hypothetical protein n=1 Tax=Pelagicoccus sp. SDUM812002 TaxID=3041266 RepID=UPI00280DE9B0